MGHEVIYSCALIHFFSPLRLAPCEQVELQDLAISDQTMPTTMVLSTSVPGALNLEVNLELASIRYLVTARRKVMIIDINFLLGTQHLN